MLVFQPLDLGLEIEFGVLLAEQRLQLGDRGPLDGLAGDRALEDVVGLVLGVERQLEVDSVEDVDVGEDRAPRRA